jgi:membrane fusion protein (multidrug efflux system)
MTTTRKSKSIKSFGRGALAVGVIAIAALAGWHFYGGPDQRKTDDAYVNANIVNVAAEVTGRVTAVHAREGTFVRAGDALFEIDDSSYRISLADAQAKLASARQATRANVSDVGAARAALQRAEADVDNARAQSRRTQDLVASHFLSRQAADDAEARLKMTLAAGAEAQSRLKHAEEMVASEGGETPAVRAAEAQVQMAQLNLARTHVVAPVDGWVANLTLTPGSTVTPNQPLFALIQKGSFWVDANFKETELDRIRPGQPAQVRIDMMPGRTFPAVVDSLGSGTGAAFSLLPPQNATGNWIKVTQRVPVRVRFVGDAAAEAFKVGASAVITVSLGKS